MTLADAAEAGDFVGLRVSVDGTTGRLMPPAAQFHVHNFRTDKNEAYFLPALDRRPDLAGGGVRQAGHGR
jgi:hypothetical protein